MPSVIPAEAGTIFAAAASAPHLQEARMEQQDGRAEGLWPAFGIGVLAGLRSMSAVAAPSWATSSGRKQAAWIPAGPEAHGLATAAALVEMAGGKRPFAPDRRIAPSIPVRLVLGAASGAAMAGRSRGDGVVAGKTRAVAGTRLGRAARGGSTRSAGDWTRALIEDAPAAPVAGMLARAAERTRV